MAMSQDKAIGELRAIVQRQQAEIAELRSRLDGPERRERAPGQTTVPTRRSGARPRLSRGGLLKTAAMGVAGLAGAELAGTLGAEPAAAADFEQPSFFATTGDVNEYGYSNENGHYTYGAKLFGSFAGLFAQASNGAGVGAVSFTGPGVQGTAQGNLQKGVAGICQCPDGTGYGVYGISQHSDTSPGIGYGVYGESGAGTGVGGTATQTGVLGISTGSGNGVIGQGPGAAPPSPLPSGNGVYGLAGASAVAILGESRDGSGALTNGMGVQGTSSGGIGVQGNSSSNYGVEGISASSIGVLGLSTSYIGVVGETSVNSWEGVLGLNTQNGMGVHGISYADASQTSLGAGIGVQGDSDSYYGVFGRSNSGPGVAGSSTSSYAVFGDSAGNHGVLGHTSGSGTAGVYGKAFSSTAYGVEGTSDSSIGVLGLSSSYIGVVGETTVSTREGVLGLSTGNGMGVHGISYANAAQTTLGSGTGILGESGSGVGVRGNTSSSRTAGVVGQNNGSGPGVQGKSGTGYGVRGDSSGGAAGVFGQNTSTGAGVKGANTSTGQGVYGTNSSTGMGVYGVNTSSGYGVRGSSASGKGVAGISTNGYGGYFQGGLAPVVLVPRSTAGAPTTGTYVKGALVVDSAGTLYICTAAGAPGTWVKVGTQT